MSLMRRVALVILSLAFAVPSSVLAQGDDALVLPPGLVRVRLVPTVATFDSRFAKGTGCLDSGQFAGTCYNDGDLEPLAVDFNTMVGVDQFPQLQELKAANTAFQEMGITAQVTDADLTLGTANLDLDAQVTALPIVAEIGLTSKLSLGVIVPLVQAQNTASFEFLGNGEMGLTETAFGGDAAAFNQSLAAAAQQMATVAEQLTAAGDPDAQAAQLVAQVLGGYHQMLFGTSDMPGLAASPFFFTNDSDVGSAILTHYGQIQTLAQHFGVSAPDMSLASPANTAQAQAILQSDLIGADPLESYNGGWKLGDIEIGAKYQFLNTAPEYPYQPLTGFGYRGAVTAGVRLPTGTVDDPNNFIDIGTGDGQMDLELRLHNDFLFHDRFWANLTLRYALQLAHEYERRVAPADQPLVGAEALAMVERNPGDYLNVEFTPKVRLSDSFSGGVQYNFFTRGQDDFSYVDADDEARIGTAASVLAQETAASYHQLGVGLSYSTLGKYVRGETAVPFEFSFFYGTMLAGSGGRQPAPTTFQATGKLFYRLWGGQ